MTTEQPQLNTRESILQRWPLLLPSVAIFLLTLLIYIPIYSAPLHWDDVTYLRDNIHLRTFKGLINIWFHPTNNWQYYPVVFTSFWIESHLWGMTLWMYHLVNASLHAVNAILLMMVLRRMKIPAAFLIAVIFACHPIHVETVVYIAERKNIYSCMFFLLAMLAYWRFVDGPADKKKQAYALAFVCFVLAILSKTVVAVFPVVMLLALFYQRHKLTWRDVWPLVPFVVIAIPQSFIVRYIEQNFVGAWGDDFTFTPAEKILIAGRSLWFYVGKILWPHPLIPIYERWTINSSVMWQYLFPLSYMALTGALVVARKKIGQGPWILAVAFFVIMAPALGFVSYYPMIMSFVSDHFVYTGSIPAIMAIVLLGRWMFKRFIRGESQAPMQITTTIVLLILVGLTVSQGMLWQTERMIWYHNFQYNSESPFVRIGLAKGLDDEGETETAKLLLEKSTSNPHAEVLAWNNLSEIATREGRHADAAKYLKNAAARYPRTVNFWLGFGNKLQMIGEYTEAIQAYRNAASLAPTAPDAYIFAAECWWQLGNQEMTEVFAKEALKLDPQNPRAQYALKMSKKMPTTAKATTAPATKAETAPAKKTGK